MNVAVIGGGIEGLLCAHYLSRFDKCKVTIFEQKKPGFDFIDAGEKFVRKSDELVVLLDELGVETVEYGVRFGVLLHGQVHQYPECFRGMDRQRVRRICEDNWRKTRKIESPTGGTKTLLDPEFGRSKRALRFDRKQLVDALVSSLTIVSDEVSRVDSGIVVHGVNLDGVEVMCPGSVYQFDCVISAIPLWELQKLATWTVFDHCASKRNTIDVIPLVDPYSKWDCVYTPYTPDGLIHCVTNLSEVYRCEFSGYWDPHSPETTVQLMSELNFLFRDGWTLQRFEVGLNGHLLPSYVSCEWPYNVFPVGRYSRWDTRAMIDTALFDAREIARQIGLVSC